MRVARTPNGPNHGRFRYADAGLLPALILLGPRVAPSCNNAARAESAKGARRCRSGQVRKQHISAVSAHQTPGACMQLLLSHASFPDTESTDHGRFRYADAGLRPALILLGPRVASSCNNAARAESAKGARRCRSGQVRKQHISAVSAHQTPGACMQLLLSHASCPDTEWTESWALQIRRCRPSSSADSPRSPRGKQL